MGKKSLWPGELKRRCEAIGWEVKLTKRGHYRVTTGEGSGFTFASTPSSRRSEAHALAEARRHGLEELERTCAERDERDRLQRIADDRASVPAMPDVRLPETEPVAVHTEPDNEEEGSEMSKRERAVEAGALGYVNGVAIAERAPAMYQTPIMPEPKRFDEGEELLLVDDRVVYRCNKRADDDQLPKREFCHETFPTVRGMMNHASWHGRTQSPKQVAAMQQMHEKRRKQFNPTPELESEVTTETQTEQSGVVARLIQLAEDIEAFRDAAGDLADSGDRLRDEVRKLAEDVATDAVDIDELREKATKWDKMREMLG